MGDSRKEVDRRLKTVCEQFISTTSATMLHLVTDLNSRMSAFVKAKSGRLAGQSWADPAAVQGVVTETIRRVKATVPAIQRKMQLYLANRETEFILFRPIRFNSLLDCFSVKFSHCSQQVGHSDRLRHLVICAEG